MKPTTNTLFSNTRIQSVSRKNATNAYQSNVLVVGYKLLASIPDNEQYYKLFLEFYSNLKKNNRVVNGSFTFLSTEIIPIISKLAAETGKLPDKIIFSNNLTYLKFCQLGSDNKTLSSMFDNYEYDIVNDAYHKNFFILTYQDIKNICLRNELNTETKEQVLLEPIYVDDTYATSHYNYFYGIKFNEH